MCETMFVFSVQVCVNSWTVLRQADLQMYLFLCGKGMFLCFYVKKVVPVDMAFYIRLINLKGTFSVLAGSC